MCTNLLFVTSVTQAIYQKSIVMQNLLIRAIDFELAKRRVTPPLINGIQELTYKLYTYTWGREAKAMLCVLYWHHIRKSHARMTNPKREKEREGRRGARL